MKRWAIVEVGKRPSVYARLAGRERLVEVFDHYGDVRHEIKPSGRRGKPNRHRLLVGSLVVYELPVQIQLIDVTHCSNPRAMYRVDTKAGPMLIQGGTPGDSLPAVQGPFVLP